MTPTPNDPTVAPEKPAPPKRPKGQFPRGISGNPAGRPRGSRNQSTLLVESLLQGAAEALTRKAIELALDGDPIALRLCLARLSPTPKDRPLHLPLGPVDTLPQVRTGMSTVLQAIGDGSITPTEGETIAQVLTLQGNVVAHADLVPRVARLEEALSQKEETAGPTMVDITADLQEGRKLLEAPRDPA